MSAHIVPVRTYLVIWLSLMLLLFATLGLAELDLNPFNAVAAMTVAVIKMLLILLYFMHVKFSSRLTWIVAAAGFLWLAIMLTLTLTDYMARGGLGP